MTRPIRHALCAVLFPIAFATPVLAADITVNMLKATQDGTGASFGTVVISDTAAGATLKLSLHGLPPGAHGFHVHENDECGPIMMLGVRIPAGAAGAIFDPDKTMKHEGPDGQGYLGDLPVLDVAANGTASQILTAPRIKDVGILRKRALIIDLKGDNYSDRPTPNGGGGGRLACGVIE